MPKELAKELRYEFSRFKGLTSDELDLLCSMVCDKIINALDEVDEIGISYIDWEQVKQEFL